MMMTAARRLLVAAAVLVALCAAGAARAEDTGWTRGARAPDASTVEVTVLLRQSPLGLERLSAELEAVSDPSGPRYGRYLSAEEVRELVAPPAEAAGRVMAWLGGRGRLSPTGDAVLLRGLPVREAERLFAVELHEYTHPERRAAAPLVRAARAPYVPDTLFGLVERVAGLHGLSRPLVRRSRGFGSGAAADPGITVTPQVLQTRYGVPAQAVPEGFNASVAMAEFEQAEFQNSDVNMFQAKFGLKVQNITVVGPNSGGYFGEASLDSDVLAATANGIETWDIAQDEFDMATWGQLVLSTKGAPLVLSVSWGGGESSARNLDRQEAELMKLASMGYSVIAASGDQGTGVQGGVFGGCNAFDPTYPATSLYVTAVGGTFAPSAGAAEQAWASSGGGFSAKFAMPKWQAAEAAAYLEEAGSGLPPSKYWNSTGRVTPDVAALATNYDSISVGYMGTLSGTSAATPAFAGMVAHLNGQRVAKGLPPLGFLNPWLYSSAKGAFTDVTQGNNRNPSCPSGFPATSGYDAVTGLGVPSFSKLLSAALSA